MKHKITKFKNLGVALKEIAQFVRDPRHLDVGKKVNRFGGLLPRELLGNWLLCAVANGDAKDGPMTFTTDPDGGDGILYDEKSQRSWRTEHVYVPVPTKNDHRPVEDRIALAVTKKQEKGGAPYAKGKVLVVFLAGSYGASWTANQATRKLPPNDFTEVWVISFHMYSNNHYLYGIARLRFESDGHAVTFGVCVSPGFDHWEVRQLVAPI